MKRIAMLTIALLATSASLALAAGGLNLYYNGCSTDVGAATSATFACDVNTGSNVLYASVIVPSDMPEFLGTTAIVDVTVDAPSLPSWWQTQLGGCRQSAVSMSFDPNVVATNTCADIWAGTPNLSVFQAQPFLHGPNTIRLNGGAAVTVGQEISVVADGSTELTVARITINHSATTGTGACAGCSAGACIVLSECYMQQTPPLPQYRLTTPISNVVTFNNGSQSCAGIVPTQNRTWGAVKNLYR